MTFALASPELDERWIVPSNGKSSRTIIDLADRHYTRQQPGTNQACRPGFNFCLILNSGRAAWVVWRPLPEVGRMDNLWAWECTLFRNESKRLSSELIAEATDATYRAWGWPPRDGLITAVGVEQTRKRRSRKHMPGHCFRLAGWTDVDLGKSEAETGKVWLRAPEPQRTPRGGP